jgi:hypothetical protein
MRYAALLLLPLSACATLTADTEQKIALSTEPAMKAECVATSAEGSWKLKKTPGEITVARAFKPLTIACTAKGYSGKIILEPGTRNRAYGNILLLGYPAFVDASTGAGYEYPQEAIIQMRKEEPKKN